MDSRRITSIYYPSTIHAANINKLLDTKRRKNKLRLEWPHKVLLKSFFERYQYATPLL
jgi:hypothetical protein